MDGENNFRWDYIKNEYLVRVLSGNEKEWYILTAPQNTRNSTINTTVECQHLSTMLKSKNIYLVFDDENGIGTLQYLVGQILAGTGWSIGDCPTFLESDGVTEKVRSLKSDSKEGAYSLISKVCSLFNAYPEYHGDTKTVDFFSLDESNREWEFTVYTNLKGISTKLDSSSIVTRLYVEGEYGDFGYVGIDDVNPTGLNYLLNFDYYKELGLFTAEHQAALDAYIVDAKAKKLEISEAQVNVNAVLNAIANLIGSARCTVYTLDTEGAVAGTYRLNGATEDPAAGADLVAVISEAEYVHIECPASMTFDQQYAYVIYFQNLALGQIGVNESAVESKNQAIEGWQKKINNTSDQTRIDEYNRNITTLREEIQALYVDTSGLYAQMFSLGANAVLLERYQGVVNQRLAELDEIEATFISAMGDMLRDGRWADENYTAGQEEALYQDALKMSERVGKPTVTYTLTYANAKDILGWDPEDVEINEVGHILDDKLNINDYGYIKTIVVVHDDPTKSRIDITTDDGFSKQVSLESVMTRIAQMAELVKQKNAIYERAGALQSSGKIASDRLDGMIDVLSNQINSTISNWYTDERGSLIFESVSGTGAMKLCGEGFMIASNRKDDGTWDWRTMGTGGGLCADEITTGFLSAQRILAGSITTDKVASNFGAAIDLSGNAIVQTVETAAENAKNDAIAAASTMVQQTADQWSVTYAKQEDVGVLQEANAKIEKYMTFDDDFLTIGASTSDFKVQITNRAINFMKGSTVLAYIDNQRLYIAEGEITSQLRIGNYVWMLPDANGSAGLIYLPQ